jgi:hypothetical protein
MFRSIVVFLFTVIVQIYMSSAGADTASWIGDAAIVGADDTDIEMTESQWREYLRAMANDIEALGKGTVRSYFGPIDYRFTRTGLKANLQIVGVQMNVQIGYGNRRRLEIDWPSFSRNLKLGFGADDDDRGYRVEVRYEF